MRIIKEYAHIPSGIRAYGNISSLDDFEILLTTYETQKM